MLNSLKKPEWIPIRKRWELYNPMHLNPAFISNIHDIYGEGGDAWAKELPQRIAHLSALWNFRFIKPMPNLSYNFVALVEMEDSIQTAILKIAPEEGSLTLEMKWLNCIDEGVPKIYAFDEGLNASLMEHLKPGHSLKRLVREGNDDDATKIICHTIRKLQSQHATGSSFRHISDVSTALLALEGHFDARLLSQAQDLFHNLTFDRTRDVILHGDLHHDNILKGGSDWKAIDPHGYVGDPAAEVGVMMRNALDCFPEPKSLTKILERRLNIMAEELPFDPLRLKSWAFCMTVLSAAWSMQDHRSIPEHVIEVAKVLDQIKV